MGQLLFTKMLIKAAIFFGFISLTFAQECATVGSSCSSGCTCPTGLTCNYNAPTDMNQYCMVSTTLAAGAYCDNHFGHVHPHLYAEKLAQVNLLQPVLLLHQNSQPPLQQQPLQLQPQQQLPQLQLRLQQQQVHKLQQQVHQL